MDSESLQHFFAKSDFTAPEQELIFPFFSQVFMKKAIAL